MTDNSIKITRQRLPHWEKNGATYFITICTWDKLELNPAARQIILDSFLYFHQNRYELYILVVMPDHLHCLIKPYLKKDEEYWSLAEIMHSLKSYTAKKISRVMNHIGTVWQPERYDRIVRNRQEFNNFWEYIYNNPVKANLVTEANDYPFLWYLF